MKYQKKMPRILTIFLLVWVSVLTACQRQTTDIPSKPLVISTIKPIQALVYRVAGGQNSPLTLQQLLPDGASPHHYALKPSDMANLESAKVIFRIDPALEMFLEKPLANVSAKTTVVALAQSPGIQHLTLRSLDEHDADHAAAEHDDHAEHGSSEDLHVWLNPQNAIAMSQTIAKTLGDVDPAHRTDYERNAQALITDIQQTDQKIRAQLANVQQRPYLAFHDAWQHFDKAYHLNFAGAVTLDVARLPGAQHVQTIRHIITDKQAACIFREPQFSPALIDTLTEGSNIRVGELDPLAMSIPLNDATYVTLLQKAADSFANCLHQ